ncbi:sensor histidine kinase [Streptomyces xiaopingdaonensis]|uniref:sensor histidine kinase n=1 Tax=Streptomyces xiaopingdaonensis TaxID=1565415 RepID=UPI0006824C49|nr:histidine kinase [Streptomyces xiaopingdaonensis]
MSRTSPVRRALGRALFCLVAAAVLALLVAEGRETGYAPTAAATVLAGALCAAALAAPARYFPLATAVAVTFSGGLSLVTTQLAHRPETTPGLTELSVLLLLVTRSVRLLSPWRAAAFAPAAGLAAGLTCFRLPESEWPLLGTFVAPALAGCAALALVLGLYLRLLDRLRTRQRLSELQQQRLEYARELHDFVAHHVTAIIAQTKAVRFTTAAGHAPSPADLDGMLERIEQAGSAAMESMRGMVSVLRSPDDAAATDPGGTLARLRPLVAEFAETGPPAEFTLDPRLATRTLPPETTTTAHRVVRESLTNIRKHGTGVRLVTVDVRLSRWAEHRLEITVSDDGRTSAPRTAKGFGLLGLTERLEAADGTFTAGPGPDGGWRVAAELPLPEEPEEAPAPPTASALPSGTP